MNEATTDQNQTDEDILIYEVSDEALEAAAGTERGGASFDPPGWPSYRLCCRLADKGQA